MLSAVSDDRPQWKIDEIILDALEGLNLSDEEAKAEFERIRMLDERQIEEELAKLEEAEDEGDFDPLLYLASNPDLIAALGGQDDLEEAAVVHYIRAGFAEGRPVDDFDPLVYLASNPYINAEIGGLDDL